MEGAEHPSCKASVAPQLFWVVRGEGLSWGVSLPGRSIPECLWLESLSSWYLEDFGEGASF